MAGAATITVTTAADDLTPNDGSVSLREAITAINAGNNLGDPDIIAQSPGTFGTNDQIHFNIPGTGVHTITPLTDLPTITQPVTIDGYTQPGSSPNTHATTMGLNTVLKIELSGAMDAGPSGEDLNINADNCTVRGLVINSAQSNRSGIHVFGHNSSVIEGNFIGTDPTGTVARPNTGFGVLFDFNSNDNTLGGTTPAARNLISGNAGVSAVDFKGPGNIVQGNLIGTDITGTRALGNASRGVLVESGGTGLIGGTTVAARNIISGGTNADGVQLSGSATTVQGNFIGTDVTGTVALPNSGYGVNVFASSGSVVGGLTATPGAPPGNLISGNGRAGVNVQGVSGTLIQGNIVGADITGTQPLGNHQQGILIVDNGGTPSHDSTVGGTAAGAANIIAFNGDGTCDLFGDGVVVRSNPGNINNAILGNSIFSNFGLGIQLEIAGAPDCVNNPNHTGDASGPNHLQNYPVLSSVRINGGSTTIMGTLNSHANSTYRLEFFSNNTVDPSGFGEGETFLGSTNVTTDGSGNASFDLVVAQVAAGVTATATDPSGNTSEFSAAAVGQLVNISTRLAVLTGDNVLIGGFIIGGTENKKIVLRAIGPSLANPPFNLSGVLADPTLELHDSTQAIIDSNDNWRDTHEADILATGLQPSNDLESAIVRTLAPGAYTAIVRGKNGGTGIGLVEAFDADLAANSKLINISTRGFVDTGNNVMIGGFIIGGAGGSAKVVVRAIGASLLQFGIQNALADPTLTLFDGNGTQIGFNDNWKDTQQADIQATGHAPTNDFESAIFMTLSAGNYTAIVRGKNSSTGVGLVEVFDVP
ncbi:MAG TPA: CSLREA domain-containing protein [Chthoniobacterales bacterium]